MGQTSTNNTGALPALMRDGATRPAIDIIEKARFGTYFPRAFACAYSLTGDEAAARDVVSEAFSHALAHSKDLSEEEFVVELFSTTRDLVRATRAVGSRSGNLTGRERELLAFMFDARLTREEIRRLMRTTERALSAALLGALRKLRCGIAASTANSVRPT